MYTSITYADAVSFCALIFVLVHNSCEATYITSAKTTVREEGLGVCCEAAPLSHRRGGAKINYSLHFIFFVATGATNYTGKFLSQGNCIVSNAVCWRAEVIDQPKKKDVTRD